MAYIAVDFDGTCVTHDYPLVGEDLPYVVETLEALVAAKHKIILWTMRHSDELNDAVEWFSNKNIPLFGINNNPTQASWTTSPKAYAQIYIDDAALGCPLIHNMHHRPYVDWMAIQCMLKQKGLINE